MKGYQISKGDLVTFSQEDLDKLEAAESSSLEILQFVPLASVDPIYFEDTYFLGPNKGGEKAYHLLAQAMEQTQRVALAKFVWRGKENLYLVRPVQGGLMLHRMYYADEVRDFGEIPKGHGTVTDQEMKLATQLIETISEPEFKPDAFHDEYRQRVLKMIEQKAEGKEVTIQAKPKPAPVLDPCKSYEIAFSKREQSHPNKSRPYRPVVNDLHERRLKRGGNDSFLYDG